MKKTHWLKTTLITLIACGIAGVILGVIQFNIYPGRTYASSSVEFSFDGAAEGIAPNGARFDLSDFTSEEVLSAALAETGLAEKYTVDQIRNNLIITGVYPEDIVKQMTGYESLLTGDAGKISSVDYHATLYSVALYNDFDPSIARADLEKLLDAIMKGFRTQFEKTYTLTLAEDSLLDSYTAYDYPQQLELIEESIDRNAQMASQLAGEHSDFLLNGEGFYDIAARYEVLESVDLERITGLITMNALSRDPERIISQYENRIEVLELQIRELEQQKKETEKLISKYSKDDIIYVSASGTLQQVSGDSSVTYDSLMKAQQETEDKIAARNKELSEVKQKLSDLTGSETTQTAEPAASGETEETGETAPAAETEVLSEEDRAVLAASVEKDIDATVTKLKAVNADFATFVQAYSAREMNDSTVAVTAVKYKTPKLLSGSFAVQAVKTAGPICAVGFIVCMVGLIVSRRKEEKAGVRG